MRDIIKQIIAYFQQDIIKLIYTILLFIFFILLLMILIKNISIKKIKTNNLPVYKNDSLQDALFEKDNSFNQKIYMNMQNYAQHQLFKTKKIIPKAVSIEISNNLIKQDLKFNNLFLPDNNQIKKEINLLLNNN